MRIEVPASDIHAYHNDLFTAYLLNDKLNAIDSFLIIGILTPKSILRKALNSTFFSDSSDFLMPDTGLSQSVRIIGSGSKHPI